MALLLLDTSAAIHLRDLDPAVVGRVAEFEAAPFISAVTLVELEGGVPRNPATAGKRRALLEAMLETVDVLPFERDQAQAYGRIVEAVGYVRGRLLDRMIAAHAISLGATLATTNARDFRDVPGLDLLDWG